MGIISIGTNITRHKMAHMPIPSASGSHELPLQAPDSPAVRVYATIHPLMHQPSPGFTTHRDKSAVKTDES